MRISRLLGFAALGFFLLAHGAGAVTHLGVAPGDHVMLALGDPEGSPCTLPARHLVRVRSDGASETQPFRAPRGKVLIVTDVQWTAFGPDLAPDHTLRLVLGLQTHNLFSAVYVSTGIEVKSEAPQARYGTSEHLTSGLVLAPSVTLCAELNQATFDSVSNPALGPIFVQGYLADAR